LLKKPKALKDHLYAFNAVTMEKIISLSCYGSNMSGAAIVALGPRWLAYPGNQPISSSSSSSSRPQSTSAQLVEVAKDVASGLYYLGISFLYFL
jgi:hypothetical protein